MSRKNTHYLPFLGPSLLTALLAASQLPACSDTPVGLPGAAAGAAGQIAQGGAAPAAGGSTEIAAAAGDAAGGAETTVPEPEAGAPNGGASESGGGGGGGAPVASGGALVAFGGDAGVLADAGTTGQAGAGSDGVVIARACVFHNDASVAMGGSGGVATTVTLQVSPFVGNYLADSTGRTLYTYGADLPGDCQVPPQSNCVTDCLLTWPIFPAGARVLPAGLNDSAFGAIHRPDGGWQTTYYGWPLYYYKTDLLLGQVAGQGKGKTWHVAQQKPPGVVIMKAGTVKYLADAEGHTLYISAADQLGTESSDPVSNCSGNCLDTFEPFHQKNFSVVTSLLISDFAPFVRRNGSLQVAYRGMPLYRAATDLKSGDTTGTAVTGFTQALP